MKTTTAIEQNLNIIRLSRGAEFVRFEIARGSAMGTMHSSADRPCTLHLDEIRERVGRLVASGEWTLATV